MQILSYLLIRYLIAVVDMCPYGAARRLGKLLGRLMYVLDAKHRRIAVKNIARAEGMPRRPSEIHRLVRRVYEHLGISAVETLLIPRLMARDRLSRYVKLENFQIFDKALAEGRGVIVVCAHLGNWELAALATSLAGYPLVSVARPIENPFLDAYVNRLRSSTGQRIVPKYNAVRTMAASLKRNSILAILADQNARKDGVFVPFFGRPASTVRSAALLALKYGAPIIPVNFYRHGRMEHRVVATPPLDVPRDPGITREEAVRRITAAFTARLEAFIREHPEQWMWLHARWKTKPPESAEPGPSDEKTLSRSRREDGEARRDRQDANQGTERSMRTYESER
ncbi:MAG: lysophospholipid acyltransferase family protein [Planctomycetes bacterium]|nr:lysophospholipid acyltransferase family protein [Planctomycetota bacterium]